MPTGGNAAMGYASRLEEIGFPEFTTKLVGDTFDALIASNIRQQQAYIELLTATSKSLTAYINDTKDDITPEEIVQLFSAILPPKDGQPAGTPSAIAVGGSLTAAEATTVNNALAVADGATTINNDAASSGNISANAYAALVNAAATRIAANKYTLLTEMVKLGMLRLVVTDGRIETKLNFHAYGSDSFSRHTSDATRSQFSVRAQAQTGGLVSLWVKASASTAFSTMRVSTTNTASNSNSGVDVQIMGGVTINFRTDYLPLDQG